MQGDDVEQAVADAVRDAYEQVRPRHREVAASLFDETFLKGTGARVLARLLVPGDDPTGADLAEEWKDRAVGRGGDRRPDARIVAAATDFLSFFEAALDSRERQDALRDLRGYRTQHTMVRATRGLLEWAETQRGRAFIDPALRYGELELDRFVGRSRLLEKVDAFLGAGTSGYFVLEGAAGLGKSAFLANLARDRDYPVHFVQLVGSADHTAAALSNLTYQLSQRWEIGSSLALQRDVEPHEFWMLLDAIAAARHELRHREPVVFVIDGLDEVGDQRGVSGNVLGLPRRLPDGVFCVVSMRPVKVKLSVDSRHPPCRLRTSDAQHLADLQEYVTAACEREPIADALVRNGRAERDLIDALMDKSAGVWLYAYHVLREIEHGTRDLANLDDLPRGLWEFYEQHFGRLLASAPGSHERLELHIVSALAAAPEPLDRTTLVDLAGVSDAQALDRVIATHAAFLERDGDEPFRLYHESARRFLTGNITHETLAPEQQLAERFARVAQIAHARIADHYITRWGGIEHGLPGAREQGATHHDGYGLRQLGAHLRAAGRYTELRELLLAQSDDAGRPQSAWYEAHAQARDHVRYLRDVDHARALAEEHTDAALRQGRAAWTIGDEYGYALLAGSLQGHTTNLPPQLRSALVKHGIWSRTRAIRDAQQLNEPGKRADALGGLAAHLDDAQRRDVLGEALDAARQVGDEYWRASALGALAAHLDEAQLGEALDAACQIGGEYWRASALGALAAHLDDAQLGEALDAARQIGGEYARASALGALAAHLDDAQLGEALDAARQIGDEYARASALGALAAHLDDAQLGEALDAARQIGDEYARASALGALAAHLDDAQRRDVLGEGLDAARQIGDEYARASALGALAAHLDDAQLGEALDAARQIGDEYARASALGALAAHLDDAQRRDVLGEALDAARQIGDEYARASALGALAAHLDDAQRRDVLGEALDAARQIGGEYWRASALGALAAHLDEAQLGEALDAARQIGGEYARASALGALAAHLDEAQLGEALDAARQIGDEYARASPLGALAAHLDEAQLGEALDAARQIGDEYARASALGALAAHLDEAQLGEALDAARQIGDEYWRASALGALAAHLDDAQLGEALDAACQIGDEYARASALGALAAHLDDAQLGEALDAARQIGDEYARASALGALAAHLDDAQRRDVLGEGLDAARQIGDEYARASALGALAAHLDDAQRRDVLGEGLDAARQIGDEYARASALGALAAHLDDAQRRDVLGEGLDAARQIGDEYARASALGALAAHLDAAQLGEALDAARQIGGEYARVSALGALAAHLDDAQRRDVLGEGLDAARQIGDECWRVSALGALAAHLDDAQRRDVLGEALDAARQIGDEDRRASALDEIARMELGAAGRLVPSAEALVIWRETLRALRHRRPLVLGAAGSWALPVIRRVGDIQGVTAALVWIRATSRWWP